MTERYDADDVKETIPIKEVIESLTDLKFKKGKMICPFHEEKSGSFTLARNNQFHCYGCGEHGTVIDFVMKFCAMSFQDVVQQLGEKNGLTLLEQSGFQKPAAIPIRHQLPPNLIDAERKWQEYSCSLLLDALADPQPNVKLTAKIFRFAAKKNIPMDVVAMLAMEGSLGIDDKGSITFCFQYGTKARTDPETSRSCFWVNGAADDNLWRMKLMNFRHQRLFITEGESDLMWLLSARPEQKGELYVALPSSSCRPSKRFAFELAAHREVYLMFDNDPAGIKATQAIGDRLKSQPGASVYSISWSGYEGGTDLGNLNKDFLYESLDTIWEQL